MPIFFHLLPSSPKLWFFPNPKYKLCFIGVKINLASCGERTNLAWQNVVLIFCLFFSNLKWLGFKELGTTKGINRSMDDFGAKIVVCFNSWKKWRLYLSSKSIRTTISNLACGLEIPRSPKKCNHFLCMLKYANWLQFISSNCNMEKNLENELGVMLDL